MLVRASALAGALALVAVSNATAATFTVNSTEDLPDQLLANGLCLASNGKCTLRAAVQQADALGGVNTINVPEGVYPISLGPLTTTNAASVLTINGAGSALTTVIDGGHASQIFDFRAGTTVLNEVLLRNAQYTVSDPGSHGICVGPALRATGSGTTVTVNRSWITGNRTDYGSGGGICVSWAAVLNLRDSTVSDNFATYGGGGIRNGLATLHVLASTVNGNHTSSIGPGGAGIESQGTLQLINSTITGNSHLGDGSGSGISIESGTAQIANSTVARNGGGSEQFFVYAGAATLVSTIVANPTSGANCAVANGASITSGGHNLESGANCNFVAATDLRNVNPLLAPLSDNGGSTDTMALLPGSPAIGAGSNPLSLSTDQRGPGYPRTWSGSTDAGAYQTGAGSANASEWVRKAYIAYYGRPADPDGLAWWMRKMDDEGGSLASIIDAFGTSAEFDHRYGGLSYADLVDTLYRQTLGRDSDPAGHDWYVGRLLAGKTTPQTVMLDLLGGATGDDLKTVQNRIDVALLYTLKVARGCPYGGELAGVGSLKDVTSAQATVWAAKAALYARCGP